MPEQKKQYTITLRGRLQDVGFRGYLQDLCKSLGVPAIVCDSAKTS
jgi:acylphosphatase